MTGFSLKSSGQNTLLINEEVIQLMREIKTTLCNHDTDGVIVLLEQMERKFPDDAMVLYTNKILGDLYMAQDKVDTALTKLRYAFHYVPASRAVLLAGDTRCDSVYRRYFTSYSKADVCLSLSRAFTSQGMLDSSLYYLRLGDGALNPYRSCGNGTKSYQSSLSPLIADNYLALEDTTQAINRLLDFFLEWNGDMKLITQRLKEVLLLQYTQDEIRREVLSGIARLERKKHGETSFLLLPLFHHTVEMYDGSGKSLRYQKKALYKHASVQYLLHG